MPKPRLYMSDPKDWTIKTLEWVKKHHIEQERQTDELNKTFKP